MESVIVYTGKDLRQMREDDGCGHWTASAIRVEAAQYLICVRNQREKWAAKDFEHGTAFLIAKITSAKPSVHAARIIVSFDSFAMLDIRDAWALLAKGQRFPVAYLETNELLQRLQLDPDKLTWQSFEGKHEQPHKLTPAAPHLHLTEPGVPEAGQAEVGVQLQEGFAETLYQAKRVLADSLGISVQRIDITIRF
jgi:hypothetical protein